MVSRAAREALADWLMALGAPLLLISEFLTWSHQFSVGFLVRWRGSAALMGIPRDPNAWQVYSVADLLLALLAAGVLAVALWGGRTRRRVLAGALAVAIAFTLHALAAPPTNGALLFDPAAGRYAADAPGSGAGEVVALLALVIAAAGVALSCSADS